MPHRVGRPRRKRRHPTLKEALGQVLRCLREEVGISQERLGLDTGSHRTFISLVERGKQAPSIESIFRFAEHLGVRPSEIIRRVEERKPVVPPPRTRSSF